MTLSIAKKLHKIAQSLLLVASDVDAVKKKVDSIVSTAGRNLDLDKYLSGKGYREEGGKVYIDPSKLTEAELKKITTHMKALGYDWHSADDTKEILQKHVAHGWDGEQALAIKKSLGADVDPQRGANRGQLNRITRDFGTTNNFLEAGYILANGNLLDLSGKKDGGPTGTRAHDHRIVGGYMGSSGTEGMKAFMDTHRAIRIMHATNGDATVHIRTKPTEAQYRQLRNLFIEVNRMGGSVCVDVVGNREDYKIGENPSKIVTDIKGWAGDLSERND